MNEIWNQVTTEAQVEAFAARTNDLHDGIAKELRWVSNNMLHADGSLAFGDWGTLEVRFGIQREPCTTFRVRCSSVSELRLNQRNDAVLKIVLDSPCRDRHTKKEIVLTALTMQVHCARLEWLADEPNGS